MAHSSPVVFKVVPGAPSAHLFHVQCRLEDPDPEGQIFWMAAWIPGSYLIRDFARHVVRLQAEAGGQVVPVEKLDKQRWRCAPCSGPLTLAYEVYAWDLSVRGAHLDTTHAFFNGTALFLCPRGREQAPFLVELRPPEGPAYAEWRVATSMTPAGAPAHGFGIYQADSFEDLIDHPVECGTFTLAAFEAGGVHHEVAITGRQSADVERLCADLRRICTHHIQFFGEPAPMARYLFLLTVVGEGYGGLEHRGSSSLICKREDLPRPGRIPVSEGYRGLLGLFSHEYFHTWQVKRIRPAVFIDADLTREAYTRLLWVFEGITSYYDDLALVRSGVIEAEEYLELLGQTATRVWRGSGRFKQSLADASFDAWIKFYKADENAPNALVSYYGKGALAALALDLTLRRATACAVNLDDLMRELWRRYGLTGKGLAEEDFEVLAAEVAGIPLDGFFAQAIRGTGDLPLQELLAFVGVDFRLRPAESQDDKGGKPSAQPEWVHRASLGVHFEAAEGGVRLTRVLDGGAARAAGLSAGDVVVAVNRLRVQARDFERSIAAFAIGETVRVCAFRRDELSEFPVILQAAPDDTCVLTLVEAVDEGTRLRRDAWLHGRHGVEWTPHPLPSGG